MFIGFQSVPKFPEYEVICPQSKESFTLKSLTVADEEKLKGSIFSSTKIMDHLNRCIYNAIVSAPDKIKNYDDFLENVTVTDRVALLYGLYYISYGDMRAYSVTCSNCDNKYDVKIKASDTFHMNLYPGDDDLTKKIVKVPLEIVNTVTAYIKEPTLKDEYEIAKKFGPSMTDENTNIFNDSMIIAKFVENIAATGNDESANQKVEYVERTDIIEAFSSLPPKDRRIIMEAYKENFEKYCVELKMGVECPKCGHSEIVNIDLVTQFFREIWTG